MQMPSAKWGGDTCLRGERRYGRKLQVKPVDLYIFTCGIGRCPLPSLLLCIGSSVFFLPTFFFSFQGSLDPPFWGRSSLWSFGEGGFAIDRLFLSLFFTRAFSPLFLRIVLIRCELS